MIFKKYFPRRHYQTMQLFTILTSPTPNQQYSLTAPLQQIIITFLLLPRQPWKETREDYLSLLLQTPVENSDQYHTSKLKAYHLELRARGNLQKRLYGKNIGQTFYNKKKTNQTKPTAHQANGTDQR